MELSKFYDLDAIVEHARVTGSAGMGGTQQINCIVCRKALWPEEFAAHADACQGALVSFALRKRTEL